MDRLILGFKKSIVIMAVFSFIMLPIMQFFSEGIVRVFVDDPEVIRCGAKGLRITSWFYIVLGIINVSRGILNGVGDAAFALINGGVEVAVRVILPIAFVALPFFGVWGIWWSVGVCWFISAVSCVWRYRVWKKKNFPSAAPEAVQLC
jgi:Na+-driven multidrug efflux pump